MIGKGIKKYYEIKASKRILTYKILLKAVDSVDLSIKKGEVIALVGESGCGKTTLGKLLINLIPPTDGNLFFSPSEKLVKEISDGKEFSAKEVSSNSVYKYGKRKMRSLRKKMQIVFQDPYSSLDPRYLVKDVIAEPLISFGVKKEEAYDKALNLLNEVGLSSDFMNRYPHQLSGGQRQRIAVARALALEPEFIVLDEPTSALDVSVQAQVLNLLEELRGKYDLTMLFITHNMIVARHTCNRIYVMYLGKIVEVANTEDLFSKPLHPYSISLLSAVPVPNPKNKRSRIILEGDVPSPIFKPRGCSFHTRCSYAFEKCGWAAPEVLEGLNVVLDPTRNLELHGLSEQYEPEILDDDQLVINFQGKLDQDQFEMIESVVEKEKKKGKIRSLFGIRSLELRNGALHMTTFTNIKVPELMDGGNEHMAACWLLEKEGPDSLTKVAQ